MGFDIVLWALVGLLGYLAWILIAAARSGHLVVLYRRHLRERRRERLFLASTAFFITFAVVRIISWANYNRLGPFRDIYVRGVHVHHLVFGIVLLLLVGYGWLAQVGTGAPGSNAWISGFMAIFYGIGAALTLDEFALWINLRDVYWSIEGRDSIRVVFLFGGLLSMDFWGSRFLSAASREALRVFRHKGNISAAEPEQEAELRQPVRPRRPAVVYYPAFNAPETAELSDSSDEPAKSA